MTPEDRPQATLRRMGMALAVAYVLVLQALLGGFATGAHAASGFAVDAFGQVLCLGTHGAPSAPPDPTHHTPDCCTTGCQASLGASLPPPVPAGLARRFAPALVNAPLPREAVVAGGVERSPRHARAPPLA